MHSRNAGKPSRAPAVIVAREWAGVHVEHVDLSVEPVEAGPARARVQACVELGERLLPADVRVEVVPDVASAGSPASLRLWSTRSYHNGSYLFEANAPADELSRAGELTVCILPSGESAGDVQPVIARIVWPADQDTR